MLKRISRVRLVAPALAGALLCCAGCNLLPADGGGPKPFAALTTFRDVTAEAGLRYRWEIHGPRPLNILQTIGNGCAFLDYDGDGNLDILLVGPRPGLFRGDGSGKFSDVTPLLGGIQGRFLGCAVGDADGDGFPDIYLSGYRDGRLLHNQGGKGFADITALAGLKPQPWGTSCAFAETRPGSGKLDLIIANYARFGPEPGIKQLCDTHDKDGAMVKTSCGPRDYEPLKGAFYRNLGGLEFADVSAEVGFNALSGRGLGVAVADYDGSGRPSIAFANDEIGGDLMRWNGKRYENVATLANTAYDRDGNVHGGMGVAWGDYNNDGLFDLMVATYQGEPKSLYHNDGGGIFTDRSYLTGIGIPTAPYVSFGTSFLDYDNDGWLDILVANGHVQDNIEQINPNATYRQPALLFHNKGAGANGQISFEDVSKDNPALQRPMVGRGLATGDYDNDGKIDALIVDSEGEPLLLHNETKNANRWLGIKLVGSQSNRDGYGARVTLEVGGAKRVRHCHADGSYLSSSDPRLLFGLGAAAGQPKITIRWPSGKTETWDNLPTNRYTTITEGGG